MKNNIITAAALLMLLGTGGCSQNDRFYFDTDYRALNIWLGDEMMTRRVDSVIYNFAYHKDMDSVMFHVQVAGLPVASQTVFTLEAVEGDRDKVEYVVGDYTLSEGEYSGSFPIYFRKADGFDEFTDADGYIVFGMKANDTFQPGANNTLRISLSNSVGKPANWDEAVYPERPLSTYFGTYSDVKYSFMIQVTGLSNFKIIYSTSNLQPGEISHLEAAYLQQKCRLALQEYNATHDEPLTDENDVTVTF